MPSVSGWRQFRATKGGYKTVGALFAVPAGAGQRRVTAVIGDRCPHQPAGVWGAVVGPVLPPIVAMAGLMAHGVGARAAIALTGAPSASTGWLFAAVAVLAAAVVALAALLTASRRHARRQAGKLDDVHASVAGRVHSRTLELESARHRMMQILHAAGEGIYGVDAEGKTTFCNPAALRMLGYGHEAEVFRRPSHALFHHHHADGSPYARDDCPVAATLRDGRIGSYKGDVFWRKDGSSFPVEFSTNPVRVEGEITGAVVVFRDITERLAQDEELRQSNRDLEAYATLASHDLQAPLRQIRGFAEILAAQHEALDADGQACVAAIAESAVRMQAIIDRLLAYSKLASSKPAMGRVALGEVVADALEVLEVPLQEVHGEVHVSPLPVVTGDASRLFQVFQNLLQNSVRYRHPERPLSIHITSETIGALHRITVRDNGIGFDNAHRERIFAMFQRLQEKSRAGVGLGLAIVRRTIEQHNGTIRAEGVPGEGATFVIELPAGAT